MWILGSGRREQPLLACPVLGFVFCLCGRNKWIQAICPHFQTKHICVRQQQRDAWDRWGFQHRHSSVSTLHPCSSPGEQPGCSALPNRCQVMDAGAKMQALSLENLAGILALSSQPRLDINSFCQKSAYRFTLFIFIPDCISRWEL